MTDKLQTKERAPRTPRNYQSILNGALSLSLQDRANLVKEIRESVKKDVDNANAAAKLSTEIANGL